MVGKFNRCCCKDQEPDKPIFCVNKSSTTGTLEDDFAPTPFYNPNLPAGDVNPNGFLFGQTWEGWRTWRQNIQTYGSGSGGYPWKRIPIDQRFAGLEVLPPDIVSFPNSINQFFRSNSVTRHRDELLYSIDILQAKYYTQIDINLDFQYAPLFNSTGDQLFFFNSAYYSPSFSFAGIFFEQQEYLGGSGASMGPLLTVFMRRDSFDPWTGGQGGWSHYWYITDRTSPTNFAQLKQVNLIPDQRPTKRLGCLAECINLNEINSVNRPLLKYTLDIDGVVIYSNTYRLNDPYAGLYGGVNGWRPNGYCRCILAGHIGTRGASGLLGFPYSNNNFSAFTLWNYNPEQYYWADNFKLEEIPL